MNLDVAGLPESVGNRIGHHQRRDEMVAALLRNKSDVGQGEKIPENTFI